MAANERIRNGPAHGLSAEHRVERLVRADLRALAPYVVDDASGMIKLDAMENPYVWPDDMRAEWLKLLAEVHVNRYPDPSASALKARLREVEGLTNAQALALGNGSDELIQVLVTAFVREGASVLSVTPSFVMYRRSCISAGMAYEEVPLDPESFDLDLDVMLSAIGRRRPALIFLAYPNNPTGNLFDTDAIEAIARSADGLVVIDEAYAPFAGKTWLERAQDFENVVVMRTLSKLGLAGLRLGFLVGAPAWIEQVEKLRLPYNVNVLSQRTATFALERRDVLRSQTEEICRQREALTAALDGIDGVRVWPSRANFLLFRTTRADARPVFEGLKQRKVLVKNLDGTAPPLKNCLRVTVGTAEENAAFLVALEETLR